MMNHPSVYLKMRTASESPQFRISADRAISLHDQTHEFTAIYRDQIPRDALHQLSKNSALVLLVGPASSGKITSLFEILSYFANLGAHVSFNASEIYKNSTFDDLLDDSVSRKYLSSIPLDTQLKKRSLDSRLVARLMKQLASKAMSENAQPGPSCLLVNLYIDSKVLTVADVDDAEILNTHTSKKASTSSGSSESRSALPRSESDRSQNSLASIFRRRQSAANVSFLVHLDQGGSQDVIQTSLTNVSQVVSNFSMGKPKAPRSVLPSAASTRMPNYARPTVSSSTPTKPLSTFRVSKPFRSRVPIQKSLQKELVSRQRVVSRSQSASVSPSYNPRQLQNLQKIVDQLSSQLSQERSHYSTSIRSLQIEVRQVKQESLASLREDLTNARMGLERVSRDLDAKAEQSQSLDGQLSELKSKKSQLDVKLSEVTQMLDEQSRELARSREHSAEEKRSLASAFESELKAMREETSSLEERITQLTKAKDASDQKIVELDNQKSILSKECEDAKSRLTVVVEERDGLLKQLEDARQTMSISSSSSEELQAEIAESKARLQELQELIESERASSAEKAATALKRQSEENEHHLKLITELKNQIKEQSEGHTTREQTLMQELQTEKARNGSEVAELQDRVKQYESKCESLEKTRADHDKELKTLQDLLASKDASLEELRQFQERCTELETVISDLSESAKQRDIEHEKHVIRLNEELGKARSCAGSPKKTLDLPELDFNNGNNTFSSIDIFDDQTEYMNFFRRPAAGRSPVPSPTRVLMESNSRSNKDVKVTGKPSPLRSQRSAEQAGAGIDENV
ncbi:hypothetical protein OXX59_002337 [Metschnikowia pulcherrima]